MRMRKCPGNGCASDASRTDVTDPGGHEGSGACEINPPPPSIQHTNLLQIHLLQNSHFRHDGSNLDKTRAQS